MDKNFGSQLRQTAHSYNAPAARLSELENAAKMIVEDEVLKRAQYAANHGKFSVDIMEAHRTYGVRIPYFPTRKEAEAAMDQFNGYLKKYLEEYGLKMVFLRRKYFKTNKSWGGPNGERWWVSFDIMGVSW